MDTEKIMDNLTALVPGRIEDPDYFYWVANYLDLSSKSRSNLIKLIDKFLKYQGTSWINIVLDAHIKKQSNSHKSQGVFKYGKSLQKQK
jgi:hypothetical protein